MIEIKRRKTGDIIYRVDGDTLVRANLANADLANADLTHANLFGADLAGANLAGATLVLAHMPDVDMTGANLSHATLLRSDLSGAKLRLTDLTGAFLQQVNLSLADLTGANLTQARLNEADLTATNLTHANLSHTELAEANLTEAFLINTDLAGALLYKTLLARCPTLHQARGLDTVNHKGPSFLDRETLAANVEYLPNVFLRGVGYNDEEIDALRGLYGKAFRYYSCFISYARLNGDFASRLHTDLEASGVTCWKDTEDMQGGDYWRRQIDEAIRLRDKTVLVCSKESLVRPAVIEELLEAIGIQEKSGQMKLFPIRLDNFIFSDEMAVIGKEQTATGEWPRNWLAKVRAFHIPDFSAWESNAEYQKAFYKLLNDLKAKLG